MKVGYKFSWRITLQTFVSLTLKFVNEKYIDENSLFSIKKIVKLIVTIIN